MKRVKGGKAPKLTREYYNKVKKMDRQQLSQVLNDAFQMGVEEGQGHATETQPAAPGTEAILEAISQVKGIGPKKLEEIKAAIESIGGSRHEEGEV